MSAAEKNGFSGGFQLNFVSLEGTRAIFYDAEGF